MTLEVVSLNFFGFNSPTAYRVFSPFVPISTHHPMHLENDGIRPSDKEYRVEVDRDFKRVYRDALYDLFSERGAPRLVEVTGSREDRISQLRRLVR